MTLNKPENTFLTIHLTLSIDTDRITTPLSLKHLRWSFSSVRESLISSLHGLPLGASSDKVVTRFARKL